MEHPYGVQPALGVFGDGSDEARSVRSRGLGTLAALPDEAILGILGEVPAAELARLAAVSRFLYVFCNHDELWKGLCLEELEGRWRYRDSWQETYLTGAVPGYRPGSRRPRRVRGIQSDLLYTPWLCATMAVDPSWLEVDNIERRSGLSPAQFREQYELPNRPVILTDVVTRWPAMKRWTRGYLRRAFAGKSVIVGDQPLPFDAYCAYADANRDELPLYLFDKTFCETAPQLEQDYAVPSVFPDDLFALLGASRPDWRWLIIGPLRSGSSWHKDPNATSAWNGVVRGSKKWVMYPPHVTPPGVRPSSDGADVASPVSIMEWFTQFYEHRASAGCAPAECVLRAGELLFVPRGWWHAALNLEESVAVTHNFVSEANLAHVLAFLRSRSPALVSGCAEEEREGLHDAFVAALQRQRPELLERVAAAEAARRRKAEEQHKLAALFKEPEAGSCNGTVTGESTASNSAAGAGEEVAAAASGGGFSFGFKF